MTDTASKHGDELPLGEPVTDWREPPRPPRSAMHGRWCDVVPLDVDRHAGELFEAFVDAGGDANWTYLPYGPFGGVDELAAWMRANCTSDDPLFHAVIDRSCGRATGMASYLRIAPASGCIEVGHIHYSPGLQRTPAATEAMYLMMCRAFELGYRRYEWKCNALNRASRRAAIRFGFSYEGVFRQATVVKGRNRDTAWYACIDREWPALKDAYETWLSPANFDSRGAQRLALGDLTGRVIVRQG